MNSYECGDLICDNETCMMFNALVRHISGDANMPVEEVRKIYEKNNNPDYEINWGSVIESLIQFLEKPNLDTYYGYKDLVDIDKYPHE